MDSLFCNKHRSYFYMFEEPFIYIWYDRVLSTISLPIDLFTLYCIWNKTPTEMTVYKYSLFWVQLLTTLLDFVLLLIKPELNFPAISGRIFGVWDSIFELGAKHALATGAFLVILTLSSLVNAFFLKLQNLLDTSSRYKLKFLGKALVMSPLFVFYPLCLSGSLEMLPLEKGPYTDNFKALIESHPTFFYLGNNSDIYVTRFVPIYPPYINISALHIFMGGILIYATHALGQTFIIFVWCNRVIVDGEKKLSERTKQMQRKFFSALSVLIIVPTTLLGLPWIYYAIITLMQLDVIFQELNNFFFALLTSHGLFGSSALLSLYEPYRRYIFQLIRRIPLLKQLTKLCFKETTSLVVNRPITLSHQGSRL